MDRNTNFLSELELELEADFNSEKEQNEEFEFDSELDDEAESETDDEFELEFETDNDSEISSESDFEIDSEADDELEFEDDGGSGRSYESRISQILSQNGDNEFEFDQELNAVIHEMEREYFFKGLKKLARKGLRKFKSIAGRTPLGQVVNTATSLARGNIRNALRKAASLALRHGAGFIPGGAALSPIAARALNLEVSEERETSAQKAKNLVQLAKGSYQNLAQQLDPRMANRNTANAMAKSSIRKAMSGIQHSGANSKRKKGVVVKISEEQWNKVKNGGFLIIKVQ